MDHRSRGKGDTIRLEHARQRRDNRIRGKSIGLEVRSIGLETRSIELEARRFYPRRRMRLSKDTL